MTQAALSAAELAYLATHPHHVKLYLAVLVPDVKFAERVNDGDIAQGEMDIVYDGVTTGAYTDIVAGMTLLVGSESGGSDLGRVRIRSREDGTIHVAENSDVQWADDAYLTVVNNYEYWVKFSRAVESSGTITHYQDYDGGFQGDNQPPVAIMGPPACAFIDADSGVATVTFHGDGSYVVTGDSISTYSWVFPSGTPSTANTVGTAAAPHSVTWDMAGIYWVSLEITDNDGQSAVGRRPVFIFERTGANAPFNNLEITRWSGDWETGGWRVGLRVFDDAPVTAFPEGALIGLFAEEFWGSTQDEIGGFSGRENVKFVGIIERETVHEEFAADGRRYVEFQASTIHEIMKDREDYPQTLENCTTSDGWPKVTSLTVAKAAYHLLKWNSTIFDICDVYLPDSTLQVASFDFPKASLYRQVDDYLSSAIFAHACCDKQGAMWLKHDPQYLPAADRTGLVTVLDITDFQRQQIEISHPQRGPTRHVELQGTYYASATATPIISQAPGNAPRQDGSGVTLTGLVVGNQAATNILAGAVLAEKNNLWTGIDFKLAGNHSYLDIAQPAYIQHDLAAADNKRALTWTDELFVVRNISFSYDPVSATLLADVSADRENTPLSGVTGVYPVEPPVEDPPDPPPPVDPPIPPVEPSSYLVTWDSVNGCYVTGESGLTWDERNTGAASDACLCGLVKRGWQTIQGSSNPESAILLRGGVGMLDISFNAGTSWTSILPTSLNITWVGDDPTLSGSITVKAIECPNDATNTLVVLGDSACEKGRCAVLFYSTDFGQTWSATAILSAGGGADDDGYIYPIAFTSHTVVNSPGNGVIVLSNTSNIAGEADDAGLQGDYTWIAGNGDPGQQNIVVDFGEFSGPQTGAGKMVGNVRDYGDDPTAMPFHQQFWTVGNTVRVSLDGETWHSLLEVSSRWSSQATTEFTWGPDWHWDTLVPLPVQSWRYIKLTCDFGFFNDVANGVQGWIDTLRIKNATRDAGWGTVQAMGLAVDFESGANIHITYEDLGNGVRLATFDTDLALQSTVDLTTEHAVTVARPRVVWQPTVTDYGDIVLLYGANANGGWVGYSDDAGVTVSDVSGGLTALGQVYGLAAKGDGAGQLAQYIAFGDGGEMYSAATLGTWASIGSTPVTLDYRGGGFSIGQDADVSLIVGNGSAGAIMVESAPAPYTTFTNLTGDHPVDGGIVKVEWLA